MRPTLVFDVLETLVDLAGLDEAFARGFGDARVRRDWFDGVLHRIFTVTITGEYVPFDELAAASLRVLEAERRVQLDDMTRRRILEGLQHLPPHPDAEPALARLQHAGFEMHALSNGMQRATEAVLRNAGLHPYFVGVQSAELSETYKPKANVYRNALAHIDVSPHDTLYVAAHEWDVVGARTFGMPAAFIARGGRVLDPARPHAIAVVPDLAALAEKLIFFPLTTLAGGVA
jgi:2-haloacid dehalogenase